LSDPRGFLARFPDGAILDEVQWSPELFSCLQTRLSERKLLGCLNRLGYDIEIKVKPTSEPVGHLMPAVA